MLNSFNTTYTVKEPKTKQWSTNMPSTVIMCAIKYTEIEAYSEEHYALTIRDAIRILEKNDVTVDIKSRGYIIG